MANERSDVTQTDEQERLRRTGRATTTTTNNPPTTTEARNNLNPDPAAPAINFQFDRPDLPRPSANPNALQTPTMGIAQGTHGPDTPFQQSPGIQAGYGRVGANAIYGDPAVQAALADFQQNIQPGIQQQSSLMGLGRSSTPINAIARAQAGMLQPLYTDAMAREQHTQDRGYGATEEEMGRRERGTVREAEAQERNVDRLMGYDQTQWNQMRGGLEDMFRGGASRRDIRQAGSDAYMDNFQRLFGSAENAQMGILGMLSPASVGSMTRSSK
jgi:hypothetical protein